MSVDGVILAAGLSSRIGKNKMLLKVGEKTMIESCVEAMFDFCSNIIVVCGYNCSLIAEVLKSYSKVMIVFNEDYMKGMFSSVKIGLSKVRGEYFFLIPGDYPLIKSETYEKMLKYKGDIVIPVHKGEKGHPILVNSKLISEVLGNTNYESMRDLIKVHGYTAAAVEDKGILMDVDTIEDYERVLSSI